jgi:plasmid replication initiation protein
MTSKNLEVFQANKFIESRQTYSVNEKRLLSTLISFVKPTDEEFMEYELSIKDWAETLGVSPKGLYQVADEVTDGLMTKLVAVKDPVALTFDKWHVLDRAKYSEGVLTLKINKDMNNIFLQLRATKNFTHYELAEFVTLTSTHAQRIYELMKQYQHSKNRERTIELTELREMLGLGEKKYKLFSDFRKYVLNIAKKQIEANTSLRYEWKGITKRGRKIHSIKFYEIHIAGKESPTELQELAFLENYIDEEIYSPEINNYITIRNVSKNKDSSYTVLDKFDGTAYRYESLEFLQEMIAKAVSSKLL